jgi:3,4-dihydroxy 2-butanone 4-phosphate synthase/GTP cyclohydrolase II
MKKHAEAIIPTPWGEFNMIAFAEKEDEWMPHLALVHKSCDISAGPVLTRVHSECITGDLFHSKRCDCGEQLDMALKMAAEQGGIVLYLRQEGRGIGIINKLKAYNLQDKGLNTVDANLHLGLERDARKYDIAVDMLVSLDIKEIKLMTNNPEKIEAFEQGPVKVTERVPTIIKPNDNNRGYLKTKQDEMGHLYKL